MARIRTIKPGVQPGIYVIGEVLGTEADGVTPALSPFVKVGIADCPARRMKQLQTANPRELVLLHWQSYPTRKAAQEAELKAHAEMGSGRVLGEWFETTPDIAAMCIEYVS